jgi:alkanesulfonate monooxygenase SsuD/methylene tetrahydromethanopterin reductase-like flavin-dependent oxidoreductase (luciferase family)
VTTEGDSVSHPVTFGLDYTFGNPDKWHQPWPERYQAVLDQIAWVDQELRFDGVYVSEHHFYDDGYLPAAQMMCAAIAMRTERVTIGTNLIQLPLHHPVRLAEESLVLDILSRGRFRLGLGMGYFEQEFQGLGVSVKQRVSRTEESLEILRASFCGKPFSFNGKRFTVPEIRVTPPPIRAGGPPIWMGAMADPAVERAARWADGFLAFDPATPARYVEACERLGRPREEQRINCTYWCIIAEDPERAFAQAGEQWLHLLNEYIVRGSIPIAQQVSGPYDDPRKALADGHVMLADASSAITEFNRVVADGAIDITLLTLMPGEDVEQVSDRLQYISDKVIPFVDQSEHPALAAADQGVSGLANDPAPGPRSRHGRPRKLPLVTPAGWKPPWQASVAPRPSSSSRWPPSRGRAMTGASGTHGLTAWDDLLLHQTADTFSTPASAAPTWVDRWYMNIQRLDGALLAILGLGFFPNTGLIEWYVCRLDGSHQHNLRGSDVMNEQGASATSNGFRFDIVEPMHHWEIDVEVESLSLTVAFHSVAPPFHFRPIWCAPDQVGGESDRWQHFVQLGTITGALDASGHIALDGTHAVRDRTWGVRSRRPKLHNWYTINLGAGRMFALVHQERADGSVIVSEAAVVDSDGQVETLVVEQHDLSFDPASRELREGEWVLRTQSGERTTLSVQSLGVAIRGLGAGYDASQGHARQEGPVVGEVWDLADPEVAAAASKSTIDTPVRATVSGGVVASGVGVAETALGRSHLRYGRTLNQSPG